MLYLLVMRTMCVVRGDETVACSAYLVHRLPGNLCMCVGGMTFCMVSHFYELFIMTMTIFVSWFVLATNHACSR